MGGVIKTLLIEAVRDLIPPQVIERRKRGFTLPFESWLLRDLEPTVEECFHSRQLRGPWNPSAFRNVWKSFKGGHVAWSRVLTLFVLENWLTENQVTT
jgi:asparagine synthase (glutamine-hydrolysing)